MLTGHREGLDRVAGSLLEKEEVSGIEVLELLGVERPRAAIREPIRPSIPIDVAGILREPDVPAKAAEGTGPAEPSPGGAA
ncbi:MAG: hypothetical protein MUC88_14470 [Planctomycetes bacterium]|nr:hypothetical protein [Planctomycetota bacterium]